MTLFDGKIITQMDRWINGWMMDRWMDGWTYLKVDRCIDVSTRITGVLGREQLTSHLNTDTLQ